MFIDESPFGELVSDNIQRNSLSHLFSIWVDSSFSTSIVEGLRERINFYRKYTESYNIKYIHSCIGYYFNENIKVLSFLPQTFML